MVGTKLMKVVATAFLVFLVNTAYVAAFATPSIFYMSNVVLHLGLGLGLSTALFYVLARDRPLSRGLPAAAVLVAVSLGFALYLMAAGNTLPHRWALQSHVSAGGGALVLLALWISRRATERGGGWRWFRDGVVAASVVLAVFPATFLYYQSTHPDPYLRIRNSLTVPTAMEEEGGGPTTEFFPSSANTTTGKIIPSNFFMDSKACGECHKDIFKQFDSSAHHFASFNNQFYRKSVEYMQDVIGPKPSRWCAGCHDHAVFFNGRFNRPIKDQIDTPEARNGLGCTSCHAVTHVESTMGQGNFTIDYPPLHELISSPNPIVRTVDKFLTYTNPEPHRRTFMKPFMRQDSAEFCSACHKVHLDLPVNNYRWFRGFNDYDNWQASAVSGQGARSFYYPPAPKRCADCHMPLVDSQDPGNRGGKVHSHRFPAANMAVPFHNRDEEQMRVTKNFLQSGFITIDIFAVSPVKDAAETMKVKGSAGPQLASTFGVGEEAEQFEGGVLREVGDVAAPIDRATPKIKPGSTVRVDVVVRTRAIGHFFPGGTVDAFDVWVELEGRDAKGKTIFWSGKVEDDGRGPVETGAHFYRSNQLDKEGNPINKRNAWQTRSVMYVRLIPPGAADTVHYRVKIPENAEGPITLKAKLNYRKFTHYYTQFVYAGQPKPGQDPSKLSKDFNSLDYTFDPANIPPNVSGQIKGEIPSLPIVTLAKDEAKLEIGDRGTETEWKQVVEKKVRERWNDWGIGLLLQGDLKGAEYAFKKVTEAEPGYADGWVNVARVLIREGETESAKPYVAKALEIEPKLARAHFFKAMIEKADGDYDAALRSLRTVEAQYPRDRVTVNQIGRILFLQRKYQEAISALERVCIVDPEDLQMHYTMMLAYRGLGDQEKAEREAKLFKRFKAEESAQAITEKRRREHPEENNERQQIHDHMSVPLGEEASLQRAAKPAFGG